MGTFECTTMRPRIDADQGLRALVEEYAERNGLRMPRAWAELVEFGLRHEAPEIIREFTDEGQGGDR